MPFENILDGYERFEQLIGCFEKSVLPVNVITGVGAQRAHLICAVYKRLGKNIFVLTENEIESQTLYDDMEFFMGELIDSVRVFPAKDYIFYDVDSVSREMNIKRLEILADLHENKAHIIISSVSAAMSFCAEKESFLNNILSFETGEEKNIECVIKKLVTMGYVREDMVEGCGQFSLRGGILDIFGINMANPVRIEFFDEEVDSLRSFDAESQLSLEKMERVIIYPCREIIFDENGKEALRTKMNSMLAKLKRKKSDVKAATEYILADMERLDEKYYFSSLDKYVFDIYKKIPTIFDWLDESTLFFINEPSKISESAKNLEWDMGETVTELMEKGVIMPENKVFLADYREIIKKVSEKNMAGLFGVSVSCGDYRAKQNIDMASKSINSFHGKMDFLCEDINMWRKNGYRAAIIAGGKSRAQHLSTELNNMGAQCMYSENTDSLSAGKVIVISGNLSSGFEYPLCGFVLVSNREIFLEKHRRIKKTVDKSASKIRSFTDISPGDYVVHETHGIGCYEGIQKLTVDNITKDYLKISYQGTDNLYVPVDQLDLLYKYIGGTDKKVHVNKLGGAEWSRTKQKVKDSATDLAQQLINLYAKREHTKGFAFSKDSPWQREFEDNFGYIETPDQMRSIEEVKHDMEKDRPMDRLLCGDVGYGKTEVAMRAAFKAVMDSKQVAYLVPTTILAMQHYNNFAQRMSDFPIRVEMLSRFRTNSQILATLKRLKTGETDIVIGTHRLLQKDVEFHDLGLLVVDEEQRFGVSDKEKIKEIRKNVDVLTLTATPIPRTLHMAMVNIRDMSVISQPPENRYPVQTYVMEQNDDIIADAIKKEIGRGGQVYYLYNRVSGIQSVARRLAQMIPEAKIGVGHGKMREEDLEDVMMSLVDGEINILVCTTIIETGLDVPNVNTIIIENADRMGLAQLYQLRGRVGRSNRLAYAYLTYQRDKSISDVASKRLSAIREFTEFGSGFKIAMRDLEIRGAGNLLGAQQHGHMDAVGYDMYCKLLKESVNELRGEDEEIKPSSVTVDLPVDAHIPEEYIKNQNTRVDIYKRIAAISNLKDSYDIEEELEDRFGNLPQPVSNIIAVALIKAEASQMGINEITQNNKGLIMVFESDKLNPKIIAKIVSQSKGNALFSAGERPYIKFRKSSSKQSEIISNIKFLLQSMKELQSE